MKYLRYLPSVGPTTVAAVLGNAFVRQDDLKWFKDLQAPRMQIPLPASFVVGGLYYLSIGTVLHRSTNRGDWATHRLALVVAGNEIWNYLFFGRRSTRAGFLGVLGFAVPVCVLQAALTKDRPAALAFAPYTAWVIGYDVPWTYRLWRLNP